MLVYGIGFTLLGLMIGCIIGGKEGVDCCTKDIEENVKFRFSIEHLIKIKNDKKLKEKKRKELLYRCIDDLDMYINGDYKRLEKAKELFKDDENEERNCRLDKETD